jgi:uncharacterized protein YbdZ (MbtH family)
MAINNLKQIRILHKDLPSIDTNVEGYSLRYRVISDDKNRYSHWSSHIKVIGGFTYISKNIEFNKTGNFVTIVWDSVSILKDDNEITQAPEYDIWIKWDKSDGGDWIYKQRVNGTSVSFPISTEYYIAGVLQGSPPNKLSVEIYLPGSEISRTSSFLLVYEDGPHTI